MEGGAGLARGQETAMTRPHGTSAPQPGLSGGSLGHSREASLSFLSFLILQRLCLSETPHFTIQHS